MPYGAVAHSRRMLMERGVVWDNAAVLSSPVADGTRSGHHCCWRLREVQSSATKTSHVGSQIVL